jgi:hypothetical protein
MSLVEFDRAMPYSAAESLQQQPGLATLAYRSRATELFSEEQLQQLLISSQANNHKSGLTGLLLYDEGRFFQWIEGRPDKLADVWETIQKDTRHTDIELMGQQDIPLRFFGDWDMRLSVRRPGGRGGPDNVSEATPGLIDSLFRRPQAISGLQQDLSPLASQMRVGHSRASNQEVESLSDSRTDNTLRDVIERMVLPQLIARHNPRHERLKPVDLRVGELVRELTQTDPAAARDLIARFYAETHSLRQLCTNLIEPASRGLGDLWSTDGCDEVDVTIGMSRLQSGMREASAGLVPANSIGSPAVLVVPQPGELHLLGAALDAESLYQQGWQPKAEFPSSDAALQDMVSNTWYDALDLTLSTAFKREHWLPRVADTIAHVRSASRNPALVIIVGGRVFTENAEPAKRVTADAGSQNSFEVGPLILKSLRRLT